MSHITHIGLDNRGNTCFMNTVLQCLMSIRPLNDYFLSEEYVEEISTRSVKIVRGGNPITPQIILTRAYANMLRELVGYRGRSYDPRLFHESFQRIDRRFDGYQQHDCQEALTIILDAFHESTKYGIRISTKGQEENAFDRMMLASARAMQDVYRDNYSQVYELFDAQMIQCILCQESGRKGELLSMRFEPYTHTLLEIPPGARDLTDCFEEFFSDVSLKGENQYHDETVGRKVDATIVKRYIQLPKYLIIVLKRFKTNATGTIYQKNTSRISFPYEDDDFLDLSEYTEGYAKMDANYRLHAIALHSGSLNGGHYFAICRNSENDQFYQYNDSSVSLFNLREHEDMIFSLGYVLIYQRQNDDDDEDEEV